MSNKRTFFKNGKSLKINVNKRFINTKPLLDESKNRFGESFVLSEFPIIEDFEIIYWIRTEKNRGREVSFVFYSEAYGILNHFPYWFIHESNIKDICEDIIPIGPIEKPYFNIEQGGELYIFEKRNFMFVLYSFDSSSYGLYEVWYKVDKNIYFNQWLNVISWFRDNNVSLT